MLQDFLKFLSDWEVLTQNNKRSFLTEQTCLGLKVTINTALQLHLFLTQECGYTYFMTSRMNQDSLEVNHHK